MRRILLVEPDAVFAEYLQRHLEAEGYAVEALDAGRAGITRIVAPPADAPAIALASVGLQLPDIHGFQLLREVRASDPTLGLLAISECADEAHRVRGLRMGADDFLVKPFGVSEFLARVEAVLRRLSAAAGEQQAPLSSSGAGPAPRPREDPSGGRRDHEDAGSQSESERMIRFGTIVVDPVARSVTRAGSDVALSPKEYDLLLALLARHGAVATRASLLAEVWGYDRTVMSRTVDAHVGTLRRKLEEEPSAPRYFLTVYKAGYRLRT
jgi:DNA-binding response OmpR family regulator